MNYILLSQPELAGTIRDADGDNTQFAQDFTCVIGIEGDVHGLSKSDGCTITWTKSESGADAKNIDVPAKIQSWLNAKYNS